MQGEKSYLTLYRAHSITWFVIFSQNPGYISWHLLRLYQNRDSGSVLLIFTAAQIFSCHHMYRCFPALHLPSCGNFSFPFGTSAPCLASENLPLSSYYCKLPKFFTLATSRWFWPPSSLNPSTGPSLDPFLRPIYRPEEKAATWGLASALALWL